MVVWGLVWGFWGEDFSWRGYGPVVWDLRFFRGWGSLHKHERITMEKCFANQSACSTLDWVLNRLSYFDEQPYKVQYIKKRTPMFRPTYAIISKYQISCKSVKPLSSSLSSSELLADWAAGSVEELTISRSSKAFPTTSRPISVSAVAVLLSPSTNQNAHISWDKHPELKQSISDWQIYIRFWFSRVSYCHMCRSNNNLVLTTVFPNGWDVLVRTMNLLFTRWFSQWLRISNIIQRSEAMLHSMPQSQFSDSIAIWWP